MIHVRNFHNNGKPAWDVKISAIVIGVLALLLLALLTGADTGALITSILAKR